MTQAFNLSQLANKVNTSGQLDVATGVTGTQAVANGGTGQSTYTNGQLLIGNTTGNTLTKATLTAGTGITITNGAGAITIDSSGGVDSVNGQTGAVVTTDFGGIGSYVIAYGARGTAYTQGATFAGSQLNRNSGGTVGGFSAVNSGVGTANFTFQSLNATAITNLGLSGTWRVMQASSAACNASSSISILAVRVS